MSSFYNAPLRYHTTFQTQSMLACIIKFAILSIIAMLNIFTVFALACKYLLRGSWTQLRLHHRKMLQENAWRFRVKLVSNRLSGFA